MSQLESINLNDPKSPNDHENKVEEGCTPHECLIEDVVYYEENMPEILIDSKEDAAVEEGQTKTLEKGHGEHLDVLKKALEGQPDPEAKLTLAIDFMEKSLGQSGTPHFKSFWEVRNICLELFKENIQPSARATLWAKYSELSKEARRLKELLDEQSAFAVEQIEMAVKALEDDIAQLEQKQDKEASSAFDISCKALEQNASLYRNVQLELDLLNKQASRINAMRKELIKTEMRVRKKNQFFQRLSVAGDKVFPRRKELIKEISNKFISDIDAFISAYFSQDQLHDSLYFLREEIKALQGMAKLLTLNTHAFTHTRMKLSECWDKIKHLEKERKKVRAQQKAAFKENVDAVLQKIEEFNQGIQSGTLSIIEGNKKLDEVVSFMRSVELGRDELKYLRDQLSQARKPLLDMEKSEEQLRQEQEQERLRVKKQKILDIKQEIETLLKSVDNYDAEGLVAARDAIYNNIHEAPLIKVEKQELERLLKPFRDLISDKQEQALMALSDDDRQAILQLKEVLKQRKERRQEIKDQIESLRKVSGASGLGFEQAMECNIQLSDAKERLEKINQGIREIEKKVSELEKKIK